MRVSSTASYQHQGQKTWLYAAAAANLLSFRTGVKLKTILSPAFGPLMLLWQQSDKLSLTSKQQKKLAHVCVEAEKTALTAESKKGETTATHRSVDEMINGRYKHRREQLCAHSQWQQSRLPCAHSQSCLLPCSRDNAELRDFYWFGGNSPALARLPIAVGSVTSPAGPKGWWRAWSKPHAPARMHAPTKHSEKCVD